MAPDLRLECRLRLVSLRKQSQQYFQSLRHQQPEVSRRLRLQPAVQLQVPLGPGFRLFGQLRLALVSETVQKRDSLARIQRPRPLRV